MTHTEKQPQTEDGIYYMGYPSASANDDPKKIINNEDESDILKSELNSGQDLLSNAEEDKNYNTLGGDIHIDMEDSKPETEIY